MQNPKKPKKLPNPKSNKHYFNDVSNEKFGYLTAVSLSHRENGKTHWNCLCICGKQKLITYNLLKSGKVKSCGCKTKYLLSINPNFNNPIEYGQACFNHLYYTYNRRAKKSGKEFSITKEQFAKLTKQLCFYCESEPNSIRQLATTHGEYVYNGLDRVDSKLGYIIENVVPCCKVCNMIKQSLSVEQMIYHIKLMLETHEKRKEIAAD